MYDKADVKFEHPARGPHHCSECVHWIPAADACRLVRGEVMAQDWCNKFKEGKR